MSNQKSTDFNDESSRNLALQKEYLLRQVIIEANKIIENAQINIKGPFNLNAINQSLDCSKSIEINIKKLIEINKVKQINFENNNNINNNNFTTTGTTSTTTLYNHNNPNSSQYVTPYSTPSRSKSVSPNIQFDKINFGDEDIDYEDYESNSSNSSSSSSDEKKPKPKRSRGRPTKPKPERCFKCKRTETSEWRKGKEDGVTVDLCNACGLGYLKKLKKDKESRIKHSLSNILN